MKRLIHLIVMIFIISSPLFSQSEIVKKCLKQIAEGSIDDVKKQVPELLAKYPDYPGIWLLQGVVIDDAELAVAVFQKILKEYPKCEWADDAYWRIVQYFAIIGDIDKAKDELAKFRKQYPNSEFIQPASDVIVFCEKIGKSDNNAHSPSGFDEDSDIDKSKTQPKSNVKVDTKPKAEAKKSTTQPAAKDGKTFRLQAGVFSTEEAAKIERDRFRKQRFAADIIPKTVDDKLMFAVVIGNYPSKQVAEEEMTKAKKICNCDLIIIEK